jgi:hypothetical protein
MARKCELNYCKKSNHTIMRRKLLRGNYNPVGEKTQRPNVQKFSMPDGKKVMACTQCIRAFEKHQTTE